jgi:hypothetical protein
MKIFRAVFLFLVIGAAAYAQTPQAPQTEDLGMGAFANEHGAILLAVDASVADLTLKDPYVMFIVYMAAKGDNQGITVDRNDVVMIYKGQEYHMPSIEELRKNYSGQMRDLGFYRHLGKEGLISSWVRFYNFPQRANFFPPVTLRAPLAVNQAYMYSFTGFRTPFYFKNPGFKKGDKLTIKVWDKNNPKLMGECDVVLE